MNGEIDVGNVLAAFGADGWALFRYEYPTLVFRRGLRDVAHLAVVQREDSAYLIRTDLLSEDLVAIGHRLGDEGLRDRIFEHLDAMSGSGND